VKRNPPCHLLAICCNSDTEFFLYHEKVKEKKDFHPKKVSVERVEQLRPSIQAKWRL
jgi:hypothetical protein